MNDVELVETMARLTREAKERAADLANRYDEIERQRDRRFDRRFKPAAPSAEPAALPPRARARPFAKVGRWPNADWYELLLAPQGVVNVPSGCLITGGDRAWRRHEVP